MYVTNDVSAIAILLSKKTSPVMLVTYLISSVGDVSEDDITLYNYFYGNVM